LLNLSEAGRRLGKSRWTVRSWIESGYLRAVRIGDRRYVTADEVERVRREGSS
jgi:excisionase family DNA binding protein